MSVDGTTVRPELFFGIIAPIGVDVSNVEIALATSLRRMNYKVDLLRLTEYLSEISIPIRSDGKSYIDTYKTKIEAANKARSEYGNDLFGKLALNAISQRRAELRSQADDIAGDEPVSTAAERPNASETEQPAPVRTSQDQPIADRAYVLRQFKRPEEVGLLRKVYGAQFFVIGAFAPPENRIVRIRDLEVASTSGLVKREEVRLKAEELIIQDANESDTSSGQNVVDAFAESDVFVEASSKEECERQVDRFIQLLFGSNKRSPNLDEYGMHAAKSAALRSLDVSRQVGAAVFDPVARTPKVTGSNEVPKAGGGTYWNEDSSDARDIEIGLDPNTKEYEYVFADLIDRLQKQGVVFDQIAPKEQISKIVEGLLKNDQEGE